MAEAAAVEERPALGRRSRVKGRLIVQVSSCFVPVHTFDKVPFAAENL